MAVIDNSFAPLPSGVKNKICIYHDSWNTSSYQVIEFHILYKEPMLPPWKWSANKRDRLHPALFMSRTHGGFVCHSSPALQLNACQFFAKWKNKNKNKNHWLQTTRQCTLYCTALVRCNRSANYTAVGTHFDSATEVSLATQCAKLLANIKLDPHGRYRNWLVTEVMQLILLLVTPEPC